ncbi:MAG: cysteine desulfurase [Gemmataceae bacterium]|nr:cysteine desulfurase [Gemmataceae bacterium]
MPPIYLDYNATTPIDPAVADAMEPYLREQFGNPSSTHAYGRATHHAVDIARQQVALLLNAEPDEIVFTGGGTEASNQAIKGALFALLGGRLIEALRNARIVTTAIEHPATLQPCAFLQRLGVTVVRVAVDKDGIVDLDAMRKAITPGTTIVSVMHSNNEVGSLQPIREIAGMAHAVGAWMHTDAAQSLGKVPVDVKSLKVDLLSVAGHKAYAPKGVGCLFVRRGVTLEPLLHGAGHETGRRAGTENVPYIVGLGKACEIARESLPAASERLRSLHDRLWRLLQDGLGDRIVLNGHLDLRLPNTLNVNFLGHIGAELLEKTPEVAASTGSACRQGHVSLSPVLKAMHVSPEVGKGAVRLTVGRFTTEEEIDRSAEALLRAASR